MAETGEHRPARTRPLRSKGDAEGGANHQLRVARATRGKRTPKEQRYPLKAYIDQKEGASGLVEKRGTQ